MRVCVCVRERKRLDLDAYSWRCVHFYENRLHFSVYFCVGCLLLNAFLGTLYHLLSDQLRKSRFLLCKKLNSFALGIKILTLHMVSKLTRLLRTAKLLVCMGDCGRTPFAGGRPSNPHANV